MLITPIARVSVIKLDVKLLRCTPDAEALCGTAALTSTETASPSEIFEKMDLEKANRIIRRITGYAHFSIIEHASFTFSIEGVSRSMTHQLIRHRIASYVEQSQRYVAYEPTKRYVTPPSVMSNEKAKKIYNEILEKISKTYKALLNLGIPKEDARFILPIASRSNIIVTMNARELRHFFNLRCCARSQWEIRQVAIEMLRQAKKAASALFETAGPSCVERGYCPEGKLKPPRCDVEDVMEWFKAL